MQAVVGLPVATSVIFAAADVIAVDLLASVLFAASDAVAVADI